MPLTRAPSREPALAAEGRGPQDRTAAIVFAVALIVAVPVILYLNRKQWFYLDEWDFIAGRDIRSLDDLFRPHNEHWSTLPIMLYRLLFRLVGLRHYWPYQLFVVIAHLAAAALLRVVMRRAGVNAWLATAAAVLFAYFGTGRQNITWGFGVTFSGSLALGLAAIVLAESEHRRFGQRDILALACALAALMSSGVGVTMVVALTVAVLLTRGWKVATLYVTPLAGAYLTWFLAYGRDGVKSKDSASGSVLGLAWRITRSTFAGLGQVPGVGLVLAAVLVGGAVLLVLNDPLPVLRTHYGSVAGLLVGAVSFVALPGYGRQGIFAVASSRYLHLVAAMVLPAIAVAASAIATRWRLALPALLVLLLVGLPGNIADLEPKGAARSGLGNPPVVLTVASLADKSSRLPRSYRPLPFIAPAVTVGWLQDQKALGRIPDPSPDSQLRNNLRLQLALVPVQRPKQAPCPLEAKPSAPLLLRRGDTIEISALSPVTLISPVPGSPAARITLPPILGLVDLRLVTDNLFVQVVRPAGAVSVSVCHPPP